MRFLFVIAYGRAVAAAATKCVMHRCGHGSSIRYRFGVNRFFSPPRRFGSGYNYDSTLIRCANDALLIKGH